MSPSPNQQPSLNSWPLWVALEQKTTQSRGWESIQWQVAEISQAPLEDPQAVALVLQLFRDERSAYRFNLSSQAPKVFVICRALDEQQWVPHQLTVCQDVAADSMDAGQPVLDIPMPTAIHAWVEAFMAHHGEWVDPREANRRLRGKPKAPAASSGGCG